MKNAELIKSVAQHLHLGKNTVDMVFTACLERIGSELIHNGTISINGLGTFVTRTRKARNGVNPKTGEKITVPAKKAIKFTPAKSLKLAINGDDSED